jgi:hypothetical protein
MTIGQVMRLWPFRVVLLLGMGACSGQGGCCNFNPTDLVGGDVGDHIDCNQPGIRCLGPAKDATKVFCNCTCSVPKLASLANEDFQGVIDVCLPPQLNVATADATQMAAIDAMSVADYNAALNTFCQAQVADTLQVGFHQEKSDVLPDADCSCAASAVTGTEISSVCMGTCSGTVCDENCFPAFDKKTNTFQVSACICNQFSRDNGTLTEPLCSASPLLTGVLPHMVGSQSIVDIDPTRSTAKGHMFFEDNFGFDHQDSDVSTVSGRVVLVGRRAPDGTAHLGMDMLLTGTDVAFNFAGIDIAGSLDVPVSHIRVSGETPFNAVLIDSAGSGVIPTGALTIRAEAQVGNRRVLATTTNDRPVTVEVDFAAHTFDVPRLDFDFGNNNTGSVEVHGSIGNEPPSAQAGPDQVVECTTPSGAPVTLDGSLSSDPDGNLGLTSWIAGPVRWRSGGLVTHDLVASVVAPFTPPARTSQYNLIVRDRTFQVDVDPVDVTVRDTVPPTVTLKPMDAFEVCGSGGQALVVKAPTATDACSVTVGVKGTVVASSNPTLTLPVALQGTQVSLPVGSHTIEWVATDASGNQTKARQSIDVRPAVYARETVRLGDRAVLGQQVGGPFVPLAAGGGDVTQIGVEARVGDVFSVARVDVRDRALIAGSIRSAGAVTLGNQVSVAGTVRANVPVPLPPAPALNVSFPAGTPAGVSLEPSQTRSIAPGAYGAVVVKSRATLTLAAGSYFFTSLDLEPDAVLKVAANAGTEIIVRDSVIHRGVVQGRLGRFGYLGSAQLFLEAPLDARLIAPAAEVVVRKPFNGQLGARRIAVDPDVIVSCRGVVGP